MRKGISSKGEKPRSLVKVFNKLLSVVNKIKICNS